VGFEPTIQAFERAKKVRALDRADTVIGIQTYKQVNIQEELGKFCSPSSKFYFKVENLGREDVHVAGRKKTLSTLRNVRDVF
jgi:hypothetical protein